MMIKVKPKYHKAFIPTLIIFLALLVVGLLILAAFTQDTAFWVVIVLVDIAIIIIGYRSIRSYRKTRIISAPLGKVLEYEGKVETVGKPEPHEIDRKVDQEEDKNEVKES